MNPTPPRFPWPLWLLCLALASCIFETRHEDPSAPGYARLELTLKPNASAFLKRSSADTVFKLDSLIIVLSASGQASIANVYPIGGRSDTGNINVTVKTYALAPLRTWKAVILTLDTSLNPARRDTVHRDSVSFVVKPGDTVAVPKTVNPVYSILRARLISNNPDSLANNVKYVRIRVDGITRDSAPVGRALRCVAYSNNSTGYAVGDSGTLYKTGNSGVNWSALTSGAAQTLTGVSFPSNNTGYIVGNAGTALKTSNAGSNWSAQTSGTAQNLNAVFFTGNNAGLAVGNGGTIRISNGSTWTAAASTGTVNDLNGLHSTSASVAYAVGDAGTIVKTVNSGTNWTALTSGTARNLNAVYFPTSATGYAVGDSGTILKTVNSGSTWSTLAGGTTQKLTGVYFSDNSNGLAVGEGGTLLSTANGSTWTALASGTAQDLYAIGFATNGSAGNAIGNAGVLLTTTNKTTWTQQWIGSKSFDLTLAYKYFKANVSHTLIMDAIDTLGGTLRGYQSSKTILLSPGQDTTITPNPSLAKCGYSGTAACAP